MNRYHMFLIAIVIMLGATAASAQISAPVYVPFAFTANHQQLPAGTYKVELLSDSFVGLVGSRTGKTEVIVLVRPEAGSRVEAIGALVFASHGSRYVLKEVRMSGSSMHSELVVQPKPEPGSAKNQTGSTFEIAMR